MPRPKPKTLKLRPRLVVVHGEEVPARIARAPGLDVTMRPGEDWPRNAIVPSGEELEYTPYIANLIRSGDLVPVKVSIGAASEPEPTELDAQEEERAP